MRNKILSLLVLLLTAASGAWAQDQLQTEYTSNATLNNVTVSADMEIAIGDGAVVTINNGLTIAEGKTLTVNGPGTLVVKGTNGSQGNDGSGYTGAPGGAGSDGGAAITGNIVVKGATVEATGGAGGKGGRGGIGSYSPSGPGGKGGKGGKGGAAFTGAVTIFSGTIIAKGGSGGDGGEGGDGDPNPMNPGNPSPDGEKGEGGDGGNAFAGMLTFYGGTVKADGARCGYGKPDGNVAKAFANDVTMNAATYELRGSNTGNNTAIELADIVNYRFVDITAADAKDPNDLNVEPVDGQDNTWTFTQPAYDLVLTPIYAPVAQWATESDVELLPTAAEGVIAGTDAPLIVEGTVAFAGTSTEVTQGTVMYAVTSTNQATAPELTAFSANVPTAKDIADDGADVLVWYYIQGADAPDGQTATLDNTFNNSDVCTTPLTVTVLSNKFDLTLKAANANTIDATQASKGTVSVNGTDKTSAIADGKLKAIKMGSEVKLNTKQGYKFRKVEVKKTGSAVLAPALENGATVVIICNWGYATTTFTYTNNGGTFSGQASGYEAEYFYNGLELNGKNLSFSASNMDNSEYLSVGITFNTESSAYSYTGKGQDFVSFTISVNGTDVTDQLSELK